MKRTLWYLLVGQRGGANRVRIIRALTDRPQNANQLADRLNIDYNTVTYHLEVLADHDIVESDGRDYGEMYYLTDTFRRNRETFEWIIKELNQESSQSSELSGESDTDSGD